MIVILKNGTAHHVKEGTYINIDTVIINSKYTSTSIRFVDQFNKLFNVETAQVSHII